LTPRQAEVLREIIAGQTRKAIAAALKISLSAVRAHVEHARTKLDVPTTMQAAIAFALMSKSASTPPPDTVRRLPRKL
jgi:DNA-binding CsgD family transcriptional regulator